MEKKIRAFSNDKKEIIKRVCDQYNKEYKELEDNIILIDGQDLDGILDKITMGLLGEILN
jgi:hypothetical protein